MRSGARVGGGGAAVMEAPQGWRRDGVREGVCSDGREGGMVVTEGEGEIRINGQVDK